MEEGVEGCEDPELCLVALRVGHQRRNGLQRRSDEVPERVQPEVYALQHCGEIQGF